MTLLVVGLAFLTWLLTNFLKDKPELVEKMYSTTIYPYITKAIGRISGLIYVSVAEFLLVIVVIGLMIVIILGLVNSKTIVEGIYKIFRWIVNLVGILYIAFYILWGFNYYREDYVKLAGINEVKSVEFADLRNVTYEIIMELNNARMNVSEDEEGIFRLEDNFEQLAEKAGVGFDNISSDNVKFEKGYGKAKPVLMSKWMSYTGITGIYFPFTSEPNVNTDVPHATLPVTIAHEMAHQRGFAKEEEANFIAYLASINSEEYQFKYSGYYMAMQYLMNDIYKVNSEVYEELYAFLSDGVLRDMEYSRDYWKSKEGKTEQVATAMNDTYLKANNQSRGVESYSDMVRLLVSEYKTRTGSN